MPPDEREIKTLEESPISFWLSGPNGRLSRFDQSDEEPAISGDSVVHSIDRPTKELKEVKTKMWKGYYIRESTNIK